jgi:hypothetical protein
LKKRGLDYSKIMGKSYKNTRDDYYDDDDYDDSRIQKFKNRREDKIRKLNTHNEALEPKDVDDNVD